MSVIGLIMSFSPYLRSAMVRFPLPNYHSYPSYLVTFDQKWPYIEPYLAKEGCRTSLTLKKERPKGNSSDKYIIGVTTAQELMLRRIKVVDLEIFETRITSSVISITIKMVITVTRMKLIARVILEERTTWVVLVLSVDRVTLVVRVFLLVNKILSLICCNSNKGNIGVGVLLVTQIILVAKVMLVARAMSVARVILVARVISVARAISIARVILVARVIS